MKHEMKWIATQHPYANNGSYGAILNCFFGFNCFFKKYSFSRDLVWHVDTIPEPFPGLCYDFTVESVRVTSTKKLQRVVHKGHEAYILNETIRVKYNGEWIHMPKCTAVPRDEFISSISLPDATVTKEDCRRFTILYFPAELSMVITLLKTYTLGSPVIGTVPITRPMINHPY